MNKIYLPFLNIRESIMSLDDVRLKNTIDYCKHLLENALRNEDDFDEDVKNDSTFHAYRIKPAFLAFYGLNACQEYHYRFEELHIYEEYFEQIAEDYFSTIAPPHFEPYFPNRPKDTRMKKYYVDDLYKTMLNEEWQQDINNNVDLTWTKRKRPSFYLKSEEEYQNA